jgi:hypothetical protein
LTVVDLGSGRNLHSVTVGGDVRRRRSSEWVGRGRPHRCRDRPRSRA